jgi:hypothetical protein
MRKRRTAATPRLAATDQRRREALLDTVDELRREAKELAADEHKPWTERELGRKLVRRCAALTKHLRDQAVPAVVYDLGELLTYARALYELGSLGGSASSIVGIDAIEALHKDLAEITRKREARQKGGNVRRQEQQPRIDAGRAEYRRLREEGRSRAVAVNELIKTKHYPKATIYRWIADLPR